MYNLYKTQYEWFIWNFYSCFISKERGWKGTYIIIYTKQYGACVSICVPTFYLYLPSKPMVGLESRSTGGLPFTMIRITDRFPVLSMSGNWTACLDSKKSFHSSLNPNHCPSFSDHIWEGHLHLFVVNVYVHTIASAGSRSIPTRFRRNRL